MLTGKQILRVLLVFLLVPLALSGADWTHIAVATAPSSTRPVICSDPLGNLHIAWTSDDPYGELLQYATNQPGTWGYQTQIAGSSSNQAYNPSITADQQGFAYVVARFYGYSYQIKYVTNRDVTGNYWSTINRMSSGHYHESSIEVDSNFGTHVFAQEDSYGSNVYYQELDATNNVVIPNITQFFGTAIDQNDVLHFVGYNDSGILYTNNSSGSWSAAVAIDQVDASAYHPAICCDINNNLHVVFGSTDGLYYLNNASGDWSVPELVTTDGIFPNIVADENGYAHIAYYNQVDYGGLYYTNNIGGTWLTPQYITTINTDGSSATEDAAHVESKIALDPNSNTVNIVYIGGGNTVYIAQTGDFNLRSPKSTDTTSTLISTAGTPTTDTLSTSTAGTRDMLAFTITDGGGDGNATKIKQLIIQRGPGMSEDICFNDVFSQVTVSVSDGSSLNGSIYGSKILFGSLNSIWKEIPDNSALDFTISGTLKQPLVNVDGKTVQMKINGLYDVVIDPTGSRFDYNSGNVFSDTLLFQVVPDHFEFVNLGDDFYDENLIEGWWMQLKIVDANGTLATGVTGIEVTLSAVELDGITPTAQPLQSTDGLTKTLTDGIAQWSNITYPEPGQIRILASCSALTAASDTITVMPFSDNLVISMNEDVKTLLNSLNYEYDFYNELNYQFPDTAKITAYESLLLFPSSGYMWYIDSTKIKHFLAAGSDTARKNILAFGEYGLGYAINSPFAENYFGARGDGYFNHQSTSFDGVAGDPITDGISFSFPAGMTIELLYNDHLTNSIILTQTGTNRCVGVKNNTPTYRSVLVTPTLEYISDTAGRDTLISRIMQWFQKEDAGVQGPVLSNLPNIDMTEDIPYKMALAEWYPYVEDADTPDENLSWFVSPGNHSESAILNDTLLVQTSENFYGKDTVIVTVSDGELIDTGTVLINVAPVNDPPEDFALLTPDNGSSVLDTALIRFNWESADDIDSRSVNYIIHLYSGEFDTTIFNNTLHELSLPAVVFPLGTDITWYVIATDTIDSTLAENAPFTFQVQPILSVNSAGNIIPDDYVLYANYPNPFNPVTAIKYGLPEESRVTITIYDISGRQIRTLVQQTQTAGYHTVFWDASDCGSGLYFYQIIADDFQQVRKCILMK